MMTRAPDTMTGDVLSLRELSELRERVVSLQTRRLATTTSVLPGSRPSHLRGFGMDRVDTRAYAPGDDVRLMDWRATARAARPITKVFRSEKQRAVALVVDRGPTMNFGTRVCTKATLAAKCAACIAFAALSRHDRVAATLVDSAVTHHAATRSVDGVLSLLRAVASPLSSEPAGNATRIQDWLADTARHTATDVTLFIISDFRRWDATVAGALGELARRRAVVAVRVADAAESRLPAAGMIRLADMERGERFVVDTSDQRVRAAFARHAATRRRTQDRLFAGAGVPVVDVATHQDPLLMLESWL